MTKLIYFALLCVSCALAQAASPQTPRFDAMYVFGDSLSDNGNDLILTKLLRLDPAIPPSETPHRTYFQGRFSNGPIAFEYLWRAIKQKQTATVTPSLAFAQPTQSGAINFAFGGATSGLYATTPGGFIVPGLLGQVEAFRLGLRGGKPKQMALYAIWIGANDYATLTPNQPATVVSNIKKSIQRLHKTGGRHFIILNMPDLGLTPLAISQGPAVSTALSTLSTTHNALLAQAVTELSTILTGIKITSVDVLTLAQRLFGSTITDFPALETLAPGSSVCLLLNPITCPDVPLTLADPFFYWDVEHPTTYIHAILGTEMYEALQR